MSIGGTRLPNTEEILGNACDLIEIAGITKIYTMHASDIQIRKQNIYLGGVHYYHGYGYGYRHFINHTGCHLQRT